MTRALPRWTICRRFGSFGARKVGAGGGNKFPFAYIGGTLLGEPAQSAGVQLYYDPRVVHLFVEASSMRPVKGATKVNLVGKAMYADGLVFYGPGEAPPAPEGMQSAVLG